MPFHILSYFFSVICCILVYSPFGGKPQKSFLRSWDPTPSQSHPMNSSRCHWVIRILGLTFCHEISSFGDQSSTLQGTEAAATTSGHQLRYVPCPCFTWEPRDRAICRVRWVVQVQCICDILTLTNAMEPLSPMTGQAGYITSLPLSERRSVDGNLLTTSNEGTRSCSGIGKHFFRSVMDHDTVDTPHIPVVSLRTALSWDRLLMVAHLNCYLLFAPFATKLGAAKVCAAGIEGNSWIQAVMLNCSK